MQVGISKDYGETRCEIVAEPDEAQDLLMGDGISPRFGPSKGLSLGRETPLFRARPITN